MTKFRLFPFFKTTLLAGALAVSACTPITAQRGNFLEDYQIKQIKPQEHTESDVLKILGSPTAKAPFHKEIWYYLGQETEKRGILAPEVVDERIVIVMFDEEGRVAQIGDIEDERIDIPYSRDRTPTHGHNMTLMQQLLGNLGRFNPQEGQD